MIAHALGFLESANQIVVRKDQCGVPVQPTISLCRLHVSKRSTYFLMQNGGPIVPIAHERHRVTSIDSKCDIDLEKYNPTLLYCTRLDFLVSGPNFLK